VKLKIYSLILFSILLSSCAATRTYWQYESEALYYSLPKDWDCKRRVGHLHDELRKDKIPHYVVHGFYKGNPHRWIELENGIILDPTILRPVKRHYRVDKEGFGRVPMITR
jgi:hypothetical protein